MKLNKLLDLLPTYIECESVRFYLAIHRTTKFGYWSISYYSKDLKKAIRHKGGMNLKEVIASMLSTLDEKREVGIFQYNKQTERKQWKN